jgi:arylsulfatase A-like enzyme
MMKWSRILIILLALILVFLTIQILNFRKPSQRELVSHRGDISQSGSEENQIKNILFFNQIYKNYDSFITKDNIPKNKFTVAPDSLTILEGIKRKTSTGLQISGQEILIIIWTPENFVAKNFLDTLEIHLSVKRKVNIEAHMIPQPTSVVDRIKCFIKEKVLFLNPQGTLINRLTAGLHKQDEFRPIPIRFRERANLKDTSMEGILIIIKPLKHNHVRLRIKEVSLLNHKFKTIENMPRLDYFKYGGFKRRQLKSVFLPAGTTITYSIRTDPHPKKKLFLDGYLGSKNKNKLTFKIFINNKELEFKEISGAPTYIFSKIEASQNINLTVSVEGNPGDVGILGNLCLFKEFKDKRNIIFYLIDALRADSRLLNAELDEGIFKKGGIFQNAYANATRTADSLPSLFSGKYKFTLVGNCQDVPHLPEKEYLIPEYLKSKGYTTVAFTSNPWLIRSNSSQGFDFINSCWKHVKKAKAFPSQEDYINLKYGDMERYLDEFVKTNKNKPVFIYIHTIEPHVPYEPPLKMRKYSAGADKEVLDTLFEKVTRSPNYPSLKNPSEEQLETLKSLYKDQTQIAANFFKNIHKYLMDNSIIDQSSLLILSSDHGERFFEHKSWIHGPPDVYNEVVRIPLKIKGFKVKSGIYKDNIQLVDIYPTIIDWLGDKPNKDLAGYSLIDYINNRPEWFSQRLIYIDGTGTTAHYAVIKDMIKVIINREQIEIYNLQRDPGETKNLVGDTQYQNLVSSAKTFIKRFKKTYGKKRPKMSPQEKERLKTLGYID